MRYTLKNDLLQVEIDSFGAELKSVKSCASGTEFMWQGDKKWWGRTAPVLFPFVGSLKDKKYTYRGKDYPMGQHGFARDMEHEVIAHTDTEICFVLSSTEETMAKFPFAFKLFISYYLEGQKLTVSYRVENPAKETLYFSIGAHPAFNCPIHGEKDAEGEADKSGYGIYFGGVDEIHHHGNDVPTGMALREDLVLPLENHIAKITPDFFDRCTLMVEGNQTGEVALVNPDGRKYVTVTFRAPLFALWSPEGKKAPFVCIEPWYGRCDAQDFTGTLEEREYTNVLCAGENFETSYTIEYMA